MFTGSFLFAFGERIIHHNSSDAFSGASFIQSDLAIAVGLAMLSATVNYTS